MKLRLIFLTFFLMALPLMGDEISINEAKANYFSEFLNMMMTLVLLLGFALVTLFVLKKIMRSKMRHLNAANAIKIIEKRPLNPKAALYLVDILGKKVVISESPNGIHLIKEVEEESVEPTEAVEAPPKTSFKEIFQKKLSTLINGRG